ncbi:MAG: DUF3108 domain-containing protein [Pseudomonadota bacterium]
MPNDLPAIRKNRPARSGRWIALLIASALLHVVAIEWIGGKLGIPALREHDPAELVAQLLAPPPATPPAAAPTPPRPKPAAKPKPRRIAPPPAPATPPEAAIDASGTLPLPPADINAVAAGTVADIPAATEIVPPADTVLANEETETPDVPRHKISLPPSAELKYDVQSLNDGKTYYGSGTITWQSAGENYTVDGKVEMLIFTLLNFKSAGLVSDAGVSPLLYSEKRWRKSATNTHFHQERNTISFSASTATYPRTGGEQDRASIVWQLAGIGRGDSDKFVPGAEIDFFVAGVRDAETWRIRVIAYEEVDLGIGKTGAWHVVRIPRKGSYDQKLDIWFAPDKGWYPVKVRYTETNGDYLDLSLTRLTAGAPS